MEEEFIIREGRYQGELLEGKDRVGRHLKKSLI